MPFRLRHLALPTLALALALPAARAAEGTVTTLAGTVSGYDGDGGPATSARLAGPEGTAIAADGSVVIADTQNDAVRRVAPDGVITTIAGGNGRGFLGDGGQAVDAELDSPSDVAVLADGTVLISDTGNDRIRAVAPDGVIRTVAGSARGLAGDGGPAVLARLDQPRGLTALPGGGYLVADAGNARIRAVSASGVITTVAGTVPGFAGDGGPATAARLSDPRSASPVEGGGVLIADLGNRRIRRVAPDGTITTVAGGGTGPIEGGASALRARLGGAADVVPLTNGGFLVADTLADRLRRVTPLGTIVTVAGERRALTGDGGPASAASLDTPTSLTPAAGGALLVADTGNSRVRRLSAIGSLPPPEPLTTIGVSPFGGTVSVRPRGAAAFLGLREADLAPNASVVDATARQGRPHGARARLGSRGDRPGVGRQVRGRPARGRPGGRGPAAERAALLLGEERHRGAPGRDSQEEDALPPRAHQGPGALPHHRTLRRRGRQRHRLDDHRPLRPHDHPRHRGDRDGARPAAREERPGEGRAHLHGAGAGAAPLSYRARRSRAARSSTVVLPRSSSTDPRPSSSRSTRLTVAREVPAMLARSSWRRGMRASSAPGA